MDIRKKIEEIRTKPEHIRMRYLWACVGVCMFIVFAIWIISIKDRFKTSDIGDDNAQLKESIESAKKILNEAPKAADLQQLQQ